MKLYLYSIQDTGTAVYSPPFVAHNNAVAMRQFGDLANDPNTNINKHPSDYRLVLIGQWDDEEGTVHNEETQTLAWAGDFLNEQPSQQTPSN